MGDVHALSDKQLQYVEGCSITKTHFRKLFLKPLLTKDNRKLTAEEGLSRNDRKRVVLANLFNKEFPMLRIVLASAMLVSTAVVSAMPSPHSSDTKRSSRPNSPFSSST